MAGKSPIVKADPSPLIIASIALGVALLTTAIYWRCREFEFLNWDDDRNFLTNEDFRGLGWSQIKWAWNTYHLGVWHPLAWLLLSAQERIDGLNPKVFHTAGIVLHAINTSVFFLVARRVLLLRSPNSVGGTQVAIAAGLGAILFAVHPLRVEPVVWLSGQPYLPAALMYMCAVLAYLRTYKATTDARRVGWLLLCFLLYCCAVMFKAVAVNLPFVLLIIDFYVRQSGAMGLRGRTRALLEKIPFFSVALLISIWASKAKDLNETRVPFSISTMNERIAHASYGLIKYLIETIAPRHLTPYDRLPNDLSLSQPKYLIAFLAVVSLSILLFSMRRRCPGIFSSWAAYVVIILPNLGLMQFSLQLTADRYTYLATMPLIILLSGAILNLYAIGWRGITPIAIGLCAVLAWLTQSQLIIWRDSQILWTNVLRMDPHCAVAACNLGGAYLERGNNAEAIEMLRRSIELDVGFSYACSNLGVAYIASGRPEEAVVELEKAVSSFPALPRADLARAHASLGMAYALMRKDELAWRHTLKARDLGFKQSEKMIEALSKYSKPPEAQP